ncbi:MAG: hypothetical protein B7733_17290 [Myxococcales bacterium FL481]|nr:MAG: hypothetical protein B7733_17290 [Myxococcales bacterium FL481]
MSRSRGRWTLLCGLGLASLLGGGSCKRRDTLPPVVFAPLSDDGDDEAGVHDAPTWPAPVRAELDNQALVYWQHESDTTGFHVRVFLPTRDGDGKLLRASEVLWWARVFEVRLAPALKRNSVDVRVDLSPGRLEVALSGPNSSLERVLTKLASVFATAPSDRQRARAQGWAVKRFHVPRHAEVAAVDVTCRLLGLRSGTQLASRAELIEGNRPIDWPVLVDPRRAVVVVHSSQTAMASGETLGALARDWIAPRSGGPTGVSAVERLRGELGVLPSVRGRLAGSGQADLHVVEPDVDVSGGRPTLVLGRVVPTPTAADRAMARLAQRVVQESIDARLELVGDRAVFLVRVPLLDRDVPAGIARTLRALTSFAETQQTRGRLTQAARLWLGARLVEHSLAGEDWTALWSESLDLAVSDPEIVRALAREAEGMMAISPEQLQQWMRQWLHPAQSDPGWTWSVAGLDAAGEKALSGSNRLVTSRWGAN